MGHCYVHFAFLFTLNNVLPLSEFCLCIVSLISIYVRDYFRETDREANQCAIFTNAVRFLWYDHCSMDTTTYNYRADYHDAITLTRKSAVRMTRYTEASLQSRRDTCNA